MLLSFLIILIFFWRFFIVRRLYRFSLKRQGSNFKSIFYKNFNLREFIQKIFLGQRSVSPISFFIRGFVLATVVLCVYPFKYYNLYLYRLIVAIVSFYIPWCVFHGIMLMKNNEK